MSRAVLAAMVVAACSSPVDHKLPGQSLVARVRVPSIACGEDIAFGGATATDLGFRYDYDALGRLAHATGTFTAGGSDDEVDYTYDHLDHMTHMLETRTWGDGTNEIVADYDTLGDLVDYTTIETWQGGSDTLHYTFAQFTDGGQPTRETIAESGSIDTGESSYQLAYDSAGRLTFAVPDGGPITTYTYDEDARTTTIDTNDGAFHGVVVYDEANRELSETWGGSDPLAVPRSDDFVYDVDRLLSAMFRSGSAGTGSATTTDEIDTLRYTCDSAR